MGTACVSVVGNGPILAAQRCRWTKANDCEWWRRGWSLLGGGRVDECRLTQLSIFEGKKWGREDGVRQCPRKGSREWRSYPR